MTAEAAPLPVPASVLFLRLRGFADDLPSTQKTRRERLAAAVQALLPAWEGDRRVVLEAPDGLALVCPNIFTGITGGHRLDWNRFSFTRPHPRRHTPPWDHLRDNRYPAGA